MGRNLVAQPGNGRMAHRWTMALIGAAWLALAPSADAAKRLPYPKVSPDTFVLPQWAAPRLAYPGVQRDETLATPAVYDDPYEELPSEAEQRAYTLRVNGQDYDPAPAIWKIADADTTIYLLGTVHSLPPGFVWRNAAVDRIVAESHTLILESVDDGDIPDDLLAGVGDNAARLPLLTARVSPDHRDKLTAVLADMPREAAMLMDGMPTWMAAMGIESMREMIAGEVPGQGVDDWLEQSFRKRGRKIEAIEDSATVLASVNSIPESAQRRMLDAALDRAQPNRADLRAPVHAWARGDIGPNSALTKDIAKSFDSALTGPLVTTRNKAWAARLKQRLKTPGTTLFAAGAGHFVGQGSVIELLGKSGVRVTRVQ